jgi:hypothetical protein
LGEHANLRQRNLAQVAYQKNWVASSGKGKNPRGLLSARILFPDIHFSEIS